MSAVSAGGMIFLSGGSSGFGRPDCFCRFPDIFHRNSDYCGKLSKMAGENVRIFSLSILESASEFYSSNSIDCLETQPLL